MRRRSRTAFDPSSTAALPKIGHSTGASSTLAAAVAGICLTYWLIAIGFVFCCLNPTTQAFSSLTCNVSDSPYNQSQLVDLAQVTRAYTVEGIDEDALYAAIGAQAKDLGVDRVRQETGLKLALGKMTDAEVGRTLAEYGDTLSLPADAMTHLDQVHAVILGAAAVLLVSLVAGIGSIAYLLRRSRRSLARALLGSGGAVLILFALCGVWAASDFNSLFAVFHSLFFAAGTWTFSADSLLICMYPEKFWLAMGIVWFAVTIIASLVTLSIGTKTKRNA